MFEIILMYFLLLQFSMSNINFHGTFVIFSDFLKESLMTKKAVVLEFAVYTTCFAKCSIY